jgi:UDP-glucose 4-epimerase
MHARHISGQHSDIRYLPMRPGETVGTPVTADTSTLVQVGMDPEELISLDRGMYETVQWYADEWLPGWMASGR